MGSRPPEAPGMPSAPPRTLAPFAGSVCISSRVTLPALSRLPGLSPLGPSCKDTSPSRFGCCTLSECVSAGRLCCNPLQVPGSGCTSPPNQVVEPFPEPDSQGCGARTRAPPFQGCLDPHWRRKWQPTPVLLPAESQGRGAWWAAAYGAAQSRTRLKRRSSSSRLTPCRLPFCPFPPTRLPVSLTSWSRKQG